MKSRLSSIAAALAFGFAASGASAGSIFLTGHDVDLHGGQNSFDNLILDYLRGDGTTTEIASGSYRIGVVRGEGGSIGSVGVNTYEGFGTVTVRTASSFTDGASFASFLSSIDVLAVSSHTSCGGCSITDADSAIINGFSSQITTFFNAGGDIFGNSGANLSSYYEFLPPSAVASGLPIGGSSGFTATAAGTALGITTNMINGFPTHNRFTSFSPAFTVFETRGEEIISVGLRDGRIDDGGVVIPPGGGPSPIPEPSTYALMLAGLAGVGYMARRRRGSAA